MRFGGALGRSPSEAESGLLLRGLKGYLDVYRADPEAARQLIQNGESQPGLEFDPALLAAYTASAGVILNLDETITLE